MTEKRNSTAMERETLTETLDVAKDVLVKYSDFAERSSGTCFFLENIKNAK